MNLIGANSYNIRRKKLKNIQKEKRYKHSRGKIDKGEKEEKRKQEKSKKTYKSTEAKKEGEDCRGLGYTIYLPY